MTDINLKLRIKTKAKNGKKPRKKRNIKQRFRSKPENIILKAHNPGAFNPIIAHQTPLVIEKPNIEQSNKLNLLNQEVENQTKNLVESKNKVGNLLNNLKREAATKISQLESKINNEEPVEKPKLVRSNVYIPKKSSKVEREKLKEIYKELGGDDEIILNSTTKPTIQRAIKDLETGLIASGGIIKNLTNDPDYNNLGSLYAEHNSPFGEDNPMITEENPEKKETRAT